MIHQNKTKKYRNILNSWHNVHRRQKQSFYVQYLPTMSPTHCLCQPTMELCCQVLWTLLIQHIYSLSPWQEESSHMPCCNLLFCGSITGSPCHEDKSWSCYFEKPFWSSLTFHCIRCKQAIASSALSWPETSSWIILLRYSAARFLRARL